MSDEETYYRRYINDLPSAATSAPLSPITDIPDTAETVYYRRYINDLFNCGIDITPVSDDFNRADTSAFVAPWVSYFKGGTNNNYLSIVSNQLRFNRNGTNPNSPFCIRYDGVDIPSTTKGQYSQVTIKSGPTDESHAFEVWLAIRMQQVGVGVALSNIKGYFMQWGNNSLNTPGTCQKYLTLYKWTGTALSVLFSTTVHTKNDSNVPVIEPGVTARLQKGGCNANGKIIITGSSSGDVTQIFADNAIPNGQPGVGAINSMNSSLVYPIYADDWKGGIISGDY